MPAGISPVFRGCCQVRKCLVRVIACPEVNIHFCPYAGFIFQNTHTMKLIYTILLLLVAATIAAQPKTKPKEQAPTQKNMETSLKEAQAMMQEAIKDMSDEDRRQMDSLGIKMPDMKNVKIPKATDQQLAAAWEKENRLVPKKDAARIAAIAKSVTDDRMATYIASIQKELMQTMNADVIKKGDKLYEFINANSKNAAEAGNMAIGFWIAGKPEMALYLLGKVCTDNPAQTDNLANYAAMLTMQGGQHLAIPVLNNLNSKFPKNSTLLNNLGQAWFGLGDIDKAGNYLDSALKLYPFHPQANLTKAAILENKGNKTGAIECIKKSIRHAYTKEKEDKLRQLGHKLSLADVRVPFGPGADPMGLKKTERPTYPMSISDINTWLPYWREFNAECEGQIAKLEKEMKEATEKYGKSMSGMATQAMAAIGKGGPNPVLVPEPLFGKKASLAMNESKAFHEAKLKKLAKLYEQLSADISAIRKEHKNAAPEKPCLAQLAAIDSRLKALNERKRIHDQEVLDIYRNFYNDMAYWARYTSPDETMYNMVILSYKIDWLRRNRELQPLDMEDHAGQYSECVDKKRGLRVKLADFDDVGCKIRDTTDLVVWQFYTTCTKLIAKLNLKVIEYTRTDNFERPEGDTYVESSLKISIEKGIGGGLNKGPLKAEAKVGASVEFEFDRSGVKDIVVSAEAKVGVGHNMNDKPSALDGSLAGKDVIDTTIEIGIEAKTSLMSGNGSISVGSTGQLTGIRLAKW